MATPTKKKAEKTTEVKYWSGNLTGTMRVFGQHREFGKGKNKQSFISYSTTIGKKNQDGEWVNAYIPVKFPKDYDPDIEDMFLIEVKDGFLSVNTYQSKDRGEVKEICLVVTDYEYPKE